VIVCPDQNGTPPKEEDLRRQLESRDPEKQIPALKAIINDNGEKYPKLLMPIIRGCINTKDKMVKKLLNLYWENAEKRNKDGTLLTEMILVCNALKNDLDHPNEYVRGSTLRFLCCMKEAEILESLIPSITANLSHRHSYVRKHAVITVYTVFENNPDLIPDAPELIDQFLVAESNPQAKRNAFLVLSLCDQERALNYLNNNLGSISVSHDGMQLVALDLMRKVCRQNSAAKSQYIKVIFNLSTSSSNALCFAAANTLLSLSKSPSAVRASLTAYCKLLASESDSNVKLVILNRLSAMSKHERVLQDMLMDILRTLSSPNIDIRRKTLQLAMSLVSPRNVDDVVALLKKELIKADLPESKSDSKADPYRKLLIDTIHACAVKCPQVVGSVSQVLLSSLDDDNATFALTVAHFVREIVHEYPELRSEIVSQLVTSLSSIRSAEVYRVAVWILGEYSEPEASGVCLEAILAAVGPLPLTDEKQAAPAAIADFSSSSSSSSSSASRGPMVLADGTYASQSSLAPSSPTSPSASSSATPSLRSLILDGAYLLCAGLCNAVSKLTLKAQQALEDEEEKRKLTGQTLQLMVSILQHGTSHPTRPIDTDSAQRISFFIQALLQPNLYAAIVLSDCREAFGKMLAEQRSKEQSTDFKVETAVAVSTKADAKDKDQDKAESVDSLLTIRQLGALPDESKEEEEVDFMKPLSSKKTESTLGIHANKLNRVYQLTGFADPVYAEATLTVMEYDILMDVLIANQTNHTLQNLTLELHTSGDLKVLERPQTYTVPGQGVLKLSCSIKVTSTESGMVFGNIVYSSASGTQKNIIVLNNLHVDIMDYIEPATCSDKAFRTMWSEFEWENKVAVNTDIPDLMNYMNHIIKITNMKCQTPTAALRGVSNFLAANLYARSLFGEDALLNLNIEKQKNGKIGGYIRIRTKQQGIALSLGDKITAQQRFETA